jgi:hypothetical protein
MISEGMETVHYGMQLLQISHETMSITIRNMKLELFELHTFFVYICTLLSDVFSKSIT